jgi:sugar transferase EpsL
MAKRLLDLLLVLGALPLWLPLLLVLMLVVRWQLGAPVVFRQQRPGLHGKPFTLYKLRSMSDARAADGTLLPDEARLTRFGRWLRASSLDELPELWLVLTGAMSLVGPRPLLMEYLPRYSAHQARRHAVRPGLTGWAQIHGRNAQSWQQRFDLDVWYVDNQSLRLDLIILWRTCGQVLRREGIAEPGTASRQPFTGN